MKIKSYILIAIFCSLALANETPTEKNADNDQVADSSFVDNYSNLIKDISKNREVVSLTDLAKLKNPFLGKGTDGSPNPTANVYHLYAIVASRAKIDGAWYKLDDKLDAYTITKIAKNRVTLQNQTQTIELNLIKGRNDVVINFK